MIRVLLVDDERLARKRMRELLELHAGFPVVGEAADLAEAERLAAQLKPDVVFLDIGMPPADGFSLLPALALGTSVVFVTGSDADAIRALDAGALDYLLKPVGPDRLAMTLQRLRVIHANSGSEVLIGEFKSWQKVPVTGISAILSDGDYTRLLMSDGPSRMVRRTMTEWSSSLPGCFLRLSRTMLVNRHAISGFKAHSRDHGELWLKGHPGPIPLGRTAILELRRQEWPALD